MAAPTLVGVSTIPLDTPGTQTEPAILALGLPALVKGDLVQIWSYGESGTLANGMGIYSASTAGQNWITDSNQSSYEYQGVAALSKLEWCVWDGTSTNQLGVSWPPLAGTRGAGVQGLVFRPDASTKTWDIDTAPNWVPLSGGVSTTVTGLTPVNADTVTLARVLSDDDNTWAVTSTGWVSTGLSAQYRNQGGSDLSVAFRYQLKGAAAATGDATFVQTALGPDGGTSVIISFYAYTPAAAVQQFFDLPQALDGIGSDGFYPGNRLE